jgi:serine/threonine protein kinase
MGLAMNSPPDFPSRPYRVLRELGHNQAAGRVTYLANQIDTPSLVVIKEIRLARGGNPWIDAKRISREIQILKSLQHPNIPRYIDSFEFRNSFYLVQEYKDAANLTERYSFRPEDIKAVAVLLLNTLAYLQGHIPPVVHGDIKPENVLLRSNSQGKLELFLVGFGLARTSADTPSSDSAGIGTFGFIPPEQMRRQLTRASDLYAVGATLICLLSGTATHDIHSLTHPDEPYRFIFREHLLSIDSTLSPRFLNWLERMVEPNLRDRFADAHTALQALQPLQIVAKAKVHLSASEIRLQAQPLGALLGTTIRISNPTPDTILAGRCRITPLPYDDGTWIHIHPLQFTNNEVMLRLSFDTQRLRADATYIRELVLESNGERAVISVPICIQTLALTSTRRSLPMAGLALLMGIGIMFPLTIAIAVSAMGP